jgi:hypothetical protein
VKTYPSTGGEAAFVRLPKGADLLQGLNEAVGKLGIRAGTLQLIGAVSRLSLGYYDQDEQRYHEHVWDEQVEIASGLGNVSIRDGEPFVHMHIVASRRDGSTIAGHLMEGTTVFLAEAYVRALDGEPPVREVDPELGLPAWR